MSLHLGNLSSRIRREDLERVFRRFGQCTIRVVDKYGFVVFDYPASAEKALKSLKGKRICGEFITLSWSKRQPRAFQGISRGGKMYEPPIRRKFGKRSDQRLGSNNQQGHEMDNEQEDGQGRNLRSSDIVNDSSSFHLDDLKGYVEERYHTPSNDNLEVDVWKNHLEDDRWREQPVGASDEIGFENGMEFDRYEPQESDDIKEQEDYDHASPLDSSLTARKSRDRQETSQNGQPKSYKACYRCGEAGHKMNECSLNPSGSRSPGRQHLHGDIVSVNHEESNREPYTSGSRRRFLSRRDSPPRRISPQYKIRKLNTKAYENGEKHHSKKLRGPLPSSIHDHVSSRSRSLSRSPRSSSLSPPLSHSKFKTLSSKNNTQSSSLRSSTSCHSGSKAIKSRSASKSVSPTSSALAVGLISDLSSSHKKRLTISAAMENEHEYGPSILEKEEIRKDLLERDDALRQSTSKGSVTLIESNIPRSEDDYCSARDLLPRSMKEVKDCSQTAEMVLEDALKPGSDVVSRKNAVSLVRISAEEMSIALKHYGLQYPKENEKDFPVETYFGSARLWPWEIIYYRRLKKGSIAFENHAQRTTQNKESGISDKYTTVD